MEGGFYGGGESQGGETSFTRRNVNRSVRSLMIKQVLEAKALSGDGPVVVNEADAEEIVLCVEIMQVESSGASGSQTLKICDATGVHSLRIRGGIEVEEHQIGEYNNIYARFRIFQDKPQLDILRIDYNIDPYQFLYHEVAAAREYFHYSGILPLGEALSVPHETGNFKNHGDDQLFVSDSKLPFEMRQQLIEAITAFEEDDRSTVEEIADALNVEQSTVASWMAELEKESVIYRVDDGVWRLN